MHEEYVKNHSDRFLQELKSFLSIPSISAKPDHQSAIQDASAFVMQQILDSGVDRAELMHCGGNPIVYGEKLIDEKLPTVLIYGHYDVQPAEPLELWVSPPFSPEVRDSKIFARGACDDKAQVHLVLKTLETLGNTSGFPCNIKLIIEGEEEIGSVSLEQFILGNKELLKTDAFLVCDTSMPDPQHPVLITGLRGICYWELAITTAAEDLHSGMFGGLAPNAAGLMISLIAKMKDQSGKVLIPGFYEGIKRTDFPTASSMEWLTEFPSLDVNGFESGYTGNGPKTVIPAQARAKVSSRLAPGQDFERAHQCMEAFVRENLPANTSFDLKLLAGHNAVRTETTSPDYLAAEKALEKHFGTKPENKHIGGTIPVVSMMQRHLHVNPVLMGFGLDSDNIHAPNESFLLDNYYKGILTLLDFFTEYGNSCQQTHSLMNHKLV